MVFMSREFRPGSQRSGVACFLRALAQCMSTPERESTALSSLHPPSEQAEAASKVLIVGCESLERKILAEHLGSLGHRVVLEGDRQAAGFLPDVLIVGFAGPATEEVRKLENLNHAYPDVPFLIVASLGSMVPTDHAASNQIHAFLRRPIQLGEVEILLRRIGHGVNDPSRARPTGEVPRKRLAGSLRSAYEHFVQLFEAPPFIAYSVLYDSTGSQLVFEHISSSVEEILGYSSEELMANPALIFQIVHPETPSRATVLASRMSAGACPFEMMLKHKNGAVVWIEVRNNLVLDERGKVVGALGFVQDITTRKRAELQRERYSKALVETRDAERRRIARDLHDAVGAWLTALVAGLSALGSKTEDPRLEEHLLEQRDRAARALAEVRELARGLHPSELDRYGVVPAIRNLAADFSKSLGVEVQVEIAGIAENERFSRTFELHLYRIVQTLLTNVLRHAEATIISVCLLKEPSTLRLVVDDNGVGFDQSSIDSVAEPPSSGCESKLSSAVERTSSLGGNLKIETAPGAGTTVVVQIPLFEVVP